MAEIGTTALDAAVTSRWARGIVRKIRPDLVIVGAEPVRTPLPYIADDVVQAKCIWLVSINWRCPTITVVAFVFLRKAALEDIAGGLAVGLEAIAPRICFLH